MFDSTAPVCASMRRKPLAACLTMVFCVTVPAVTAVAATTWTVDSCDDANAGSGTTGSLRFAAANAVSGDTVDMTGLACSAISLTTGAVVLPQADIVVKGPGKSALTVSGIDDRVFRHTGHGTLKMYDLTVANGYLHPSLGTEATGGCVHSNGQVYLKNVGVHACRATAVGAAARGGGVFAHDGFFAKYSDISGNVASSSGSANSAGGGVFSYADVILAESTVSGNSVASGAGGGTWASGNATFIGSTVSGNSASRGGGIYQRDNLSNDKSFVLDNSTVSGNTGLNVVGGVATNAGTITVRNSTVAFNTAGNAGTTQHYSPGFSIADISANLNNGTFKLVTLQSSLFSNNAYGTPATTADDYGIAHFGSAGNGNTTPTSGGNNLVFATTAFVPTGTLRNACPGLGPLRDNGGPTWTHALAWGSPAIDQGNNTVPYTFDQRGAGFTRVSGPADIGAYEVQQSDIVFVNGFDGPPECPAP